ncbi:MAG: histidine kinase [Bacteroidales bacterium]
MSKITELLLYSDKGLFRVGRHLFLFIGMNLLFTWIIWFQGARPGTLTDILQGVLINSVFFFGYAYLTAYILVPWLLSNRKYIFFITAFVMGGMVISGLKFLFSDYLFYSVISGEYPDSSRTFELSRMIVNTKDMTFIVAIFLIAKFLKDNHHLNRRLKELQEYQIRSEIKLLKHQLDPHVVFNNLNNLYCLSLNHADVVKSNLGRLRSVLSFYFIDGKSQSVPLSRELRAIEDYINLEKLRYGERLSVDYVVTGEAGGKKLYPFVLFTFVENCFDHGCSLEDGSAWIRISVHSAENSVSFHASNSKSGYPGEAASEFNKGVSAGSNNALQLLYPGKYTMCVYNKDDTYSIDLKLRI